MNSLSAKYTLFILILMFYSSVVYPQNKDTRIFNDSTLQMSEISTNSIHSDFGPFVINDTLYFTTFNDKLLGKTDWTLRNSEFYDLYRAPIDKMGNVIEKREPVEEFITRFNDGPVSFCRKTGELFVTQNYNDQTVKTKPFKKTINRLRIMIAKRVHGKWEHISEFPYNNPEYSVGHPAITQSGDTLLFSSDRPGGFGETDLYYSVRQNGKWGIPVNLGPKINTSGKEEFAFLTDHHFNGQFLIFASKGRFGNGGFDLYYTRFPSDYSEVNHFDSPINTKYDDFALTIPPDADFGYLTSNRPGTGDDDIYKFSFKRFPKPKIAAQLPNCRSLYVFDLSSRRPIPGVRISSCDNQYYVTDSKGKVACLPCNENKCELVASTFGYPDKSKVLEECKRNAEGVVSDTIWMDILVNQKIALKNIYYDFDKSDILPDAAKELDLLVALMKENPGMRVELGSHTDDRGTDSYNQRLSQARAKSAVEYIVSKGIVPARITGTGYGKTQLIHKGTGGKKCTPEENRENRRTEIYIPGFLRGDAVKQESGDFSNGKTSSLKENGSKPKILSASEASPKTLPQSESLQAKKTDPGQKVSQSPKSSSASKGSIEKTSEHPKIDKTEKTPEPIKSNVKSGLSIKYYLILGSFQDEKKALPLIQKLKAEGYEAVNLTEPGKSRVGIGFEQLSLAREQLEILKNKYQGAWILKKQ